MHIAGIGAPVSRIVMGTDWLGARRFVYIRGRRFSSPFVDRARNTQNFELFDGVVAAGCTAFDTARAYGDSERTLGDWLHARKLRDRVAIITKGAHPGPRWQSRLTKRAIADDLGRSLKALRTDYIDLYLLHYDDGATDVGPLVDALNEHVADGRIRALGVSNWPTSRIAAAAAYARSRGQQPFAVSSVQFSLAAWRNPPWQSALTLSRDENAADREWYKASEMWLLAYSSLAMGFFSRARAYADGAETVPTPVSFGDKVFLDASNLARLQRARELARQRGVTPGQIALAWVLRHHPRVLAIVGARSVTSYVDAASACGLELSEDERRWLSHGK